MAKIYKRKLIFDNAVFSNFSRINKLELIYHLSSHIITTKEVVEEVKRGLNRRPALQSIIDAIDQELIALGGIEQLENISTAAGLLRRGQLGMGEISTMLLALEIDGIFITDDERATKTAIELGVDTLDAEEFRDTVTILNVLKKNKVISEQERKEIVELLKGQNFII